MQITVKRTGWKEPEILSNFYSTLEKAVNDGYQTAQSLANVDEDGTQIEVSLEKEDKSTYRISMDGEGAFVEFGAGKKTDEGHPYVKDAPFPVHPGSYSEQHMHQFENNGWWYAKATKQVYEYITPKRPLFNAMTKIRQTIESNFK